MNTGVTQVHGGLQAHRRPRLGYRVRLPAPGAIRGGCAERMPQHPGARPRRRGRRRPLPRPRPRDHLPRDRAHGGKHHGPHPARPAAGAVVPVTAMPRDEEVAGGVKTSGRVLRRSGLSFTPRRR